MTKHILPILNSLFVFEEAAQLNSFTKAAQTLGMAQPSVSRYILKLEDHLGVALFIRDHNTIALTKAGEQLFESTKFGLGHIRMTIEQIRKPLASNLLTVRCSQGFAHQWFLSRRASLLEYLPGYELHLTTTEKQSDHIADACDIEILFGQGGWQGVEIHKLFGEVVFPVCSPAFAVQYGLGAENLCLRSIENLPLLVQDQGEMGWVDWRQWFHHFGGDITFPTDQHIYNNYALSMQAAMEGAGIALAWENLTDSHLTNGWLVALDGMKMRTDLGYYLAFSPKSPVAEGLRRWAVDHC